MSTKRGQPGKACQREAQGQGALSDTAKSRLPERKRKRNRVHGRKAGAPVDRVQRKKTYSWNILGQIHQPRRGRKKLSTGKGDPLELLSKKGGNEEGRLCQTGWRLEPTHSEKAKSRKRSLTHKTLYQEKKTERGKGKNARKKTKTGPA